jgi:uncharacterized protein YecT (DUF1311 family)
MKKLLLLLTLTTTLLFSASFDCKKAKTDIEKLICSNEELSKLDEELNEAYKELLSKINKNDKEIIKQQQRDWIKNRNVCTNISCIKYQYEQQLSRLQFNSFILAYSEDNKTCNQFANLLNDDLKKYNEINLSRHEEFNWIKWKQIQERNYDRYIYIGNNIFIDYFDINNDGIDEGVFLYDIIHNNLLLHIEYTTKEIGNKIEKNFNSFDEFGILRMLFDNRLGKVMPEGYGFFTFDKPPLGVASKNRVNGGMSYPEPYPFKINNKYYIALFGFKETLYEIIAPPLYTMPNNGNKVTLIKFNSSNTWDGICVLTRANPNTEKYLRYN